MDSSEKKHRRWVAHIRWSASVVEVTIEDGFHGISPLRVVPRNERGEHMGATFAFDHKDAERLKRKYLRDARKARSIMEAPLWDASPVSPAVSGPVV